MSTSVVVDLGNIVAELSTCALCMKSIEISFREQATNTMPMSMFGPAAGVSASAFTQCQMSTWRSFSGFLESIEGFATSITRHPTRKAL